MYNVVFSEESDGCFVSVFDKKGNEIYNTEQAHQDDIFVNLKNKQNITTKTVITRLKEIEVDDAVCMLITYGLPNCKLEQKCKFCEDPNLIANESLHGYGLNRYLHRQFLKLTR